MAINTRNKRSSTVRVLKPWQPEGPVATGTLDEEDRKFASWQYAGLGAGPPPGVTPTQGFWLMRARRRLEMD